MSVISYNEFQELSSFMRKAKRKAGVLVECEGGKIFIGDLMDAELTGKELSMALTVKEEKPMEQKKEKKQNKSYKDIVETNLNKKEQETLNKTDNYSFSINEVIVTVSVTLFLTVIYHAKNTLKNNLKVVAKNIWDVMKDEMILVHCVSSDLVMSKGFALEVNEHFKNEDEVREALAHKPKVGDVLLYSNSKNRKHVLYMITKEKVFNKPTEKDFTACIQKLSCVLDYIKKSKDIKNIIMPAIGTGLDQLSLEFVRETIQYNLNHEVKMCIPSVSKDNENKKTEIQKYQTNVQLAIPKEIKAGIISDEKVARCVEAIMTGKEKILIWNETCEKCMRCLNMTVSKKELYTIEDINEDVICDFSYIPKDMRVGLCSYHEKLYEAKERESFAVTLVEIVNGDLKTLSGEKVNDVKFKQSQMFYVHEMEKKLVIKIPAGSNDDDFCATNFMKLLKKCFKNGIPKFKNLHLSTYDNLKLKNIMPKTLLFLNLLINIHVTDSLGIEDGTKYVQDDSVMELNELAEAAEQANNLIFSTQDVIEVESVDNESITHSDVEVEIEVIEPIEKKDERVKRDVTDEKVVTDGKITRSVNKLVNKVTKNPRDDKFTYELVSEKSNLANEYYALLLSQMRSFEEKFLLKTNQINVKYFADKIGKVELKLALRAGDTGNIQAGAFVELLNEYSDLKRYNLIKQWMMYYWVHINNYLTMNNSDLKVKIGYHSISDDITITTS